MFSIFYTKSLKSILYFTTHISHSSCMCPMATDWDSETQLLSHRHFYWLKLYRSCQINVSLKIPIKYLVLGLLMKQLVVGHLAKCEFQF